MKNGIELIAEERKRQIETEGWSQQHDSEHTDEELALAASCYAAPEKHRNYFKVEAPSQWPWESKWWKPTPEDRVRELAKAGALIAAEIDRLNNLKK